MKDKQWFIDRIGKRIFRDDDGCECNTCNNVVKNGLIISDSMHAQYLLDTQNDWMAEGIILNYRDKLNSLRERKA